ncbi:hypothetical protein JL721_336 [Aureococcus anophagefferens]|nr:hypothetical protein JL721_336 [Aureococcus anophagefferens]
MDDDRLQEILAQSGGRLLKPGENLDVGELQQQQANEEAQMRLMRQQQEAESFEKTRAKLVAEGGGGALQERATAMKDQAKKSFDEGRPQQALGLYLLGLWFCRGGRFPTSIAPSAPMPRGRTVAEAAAGSPADGVDAAFFLTLLSNLSLCCLKLKDFAGAQATATQVLESPACDEAMANKARLRLAKASREAGDLAKAERVLRDILKQDGKLGHTIARRELEAVRKLKAADKKRFQGLFAKGSEDLYSEAKSAELEASQKAQDDYEADLGKKLGRIAPSDAAELEKLQAAGADKAELAKFYWRARDAETKRVGALMSPEDRASFSQLLERNAPQDVLDDAFDAIKRRVDLHAVVNDHLPAPMRAAVSEKLAAIERDEPDPEKRKCEQSAAIAQAFQQHFQEEMSVRRVAAKFFQQVIKPFFFKVKARLLAPFSGLFKAKAPNPAAPPPPRTPAAENAPEKLAKYATSQATAQLAHDVEGMRAAGLGSADMVARAKGVFKANGEEKQLAAVELGEKMKADGASSDEISRPCAPTSAPPPRGRRAPADAVPS